MLEPDSVAGRPRRRALIYNRVSADPAGKRVSVESQERENRAFCEREGYEVAASITDNDRSASRYATKTREGYEHMKEALAGKTFGTIHVLVCWESSRAQRGLRDYVAVRDLCSELGVLFAYSGRAYDLSDPNDRLATGLHALLDEQESDKIRARILRSHRDSASKGEPRGVTPFGFVRHYDPNSGRLLEQVPDPETAPIVQEIVQRVLAGESLYGIAQDLNRREVPTPRQHRAARTGKQLGDAPRHWSPPQIRYLLSKQSLMGQRTHRGRDARAASWEAIVRPSDWRKVQALLRSPDRAPPARGTRPRYLLSGIAVCGVCGARLRALKNRGRMTYMCWGEAATGSKGHVSRGMDKLDAFVITHVVAMLSRPEALEAMDKSADDEGGEFAAAQREVEDIRAHMEQYEQMARQRTIDPARVERILAGLQEDLEAAERKLAPVTLPAAVRSLTGPDAAARWDAATLEEKRTVVRSLMQVVVHPITPEYRGRSAVTPELVEIRWRW